MNAEVLESILLDKKIPYNKKLDAIGRYKVSYSVLFELKAKYKYNNDVYPLLNYLVRYEDSHFVAKVQRKTGAKILRSN